MIRAALLALALLAAPLHAQTQPAQRQAEAELATAPPGTRFGLLVQDESGRTVVSINPDQRFIPGSVTKLFTTAAAFALFPGGTEGAGAQGATTLQLVQRRHGAPDAVLRGEGGVSLSTAPDCVSRCLAALARAVASRTRKVHDVIADGSLFAEPRWSPGMSWNNIGTYSGTALSAVMVDDNAAAITVTPAEPDAPPRLALPGWFTVINRARTVAQGPTALAIDRQVNARELVLSGTIAVGAAPWRERLGIDDPAGYAAWAMAEALRQAGVRVEGRARADGLAPPGPDLLAREPAVPLDEEVARINKDSQNIHAEALLRRLGIVAPAPLPAPTGAAGNGPGSLAAGLAARDAALAAAALPAGGVELHDGSGMSSYNRLSPAATVGLLRWGAVQPWGARWRASLPVAGVDGTLRRRFRNTALEGRLFAKTGSLNASSALAGYLTAASGRTLTFAFFANDVPQDMAVTGLMERVLVAVATGG